MNEAAGAGEIPHILYLIDVLWGMAGAEGALLRIARSLPANLFRCSVATFRLRPELPFRDQFPCPVYEFPVSSLFHPSALRAAVQLGRFIRGERVDIVHTFFETSDLLGGLVARLSGAPILISSRRDMGILRSSRHRLAYRVLHPMFNQVHAVCRTVGNEAIRAERLNPSKVVVIPNGIDVTNAPPARDIAVLRQSLDIENRGPLIITVGNIRRVKGIDILLRAAVTVCRRYPNAVFLIVGADQKEPGYMDSLQKLTRDLNLTRNVRFLGRRDQGSVWSLLRMSSVFCLPSRSEGMSNALLEAMACERPCVATAVGGTPEIIEDGCTGYLVPPDDPLATAGKVLALLDDPRLARSIGLAGRTVVDEQFSTDRMITRLTGVYQQLLAARNPA